MAGPAGKVTVRQFVLLRDDQSQMFSPVQAAAVTTAGKARFALYTLAPFNQLNDFAAMAKMIATRGTHGQRLRKI